MLSEDFLVDLFTVLAVITIFINAVDAIELVRLAWDMTAEKSAGSFEFDQGFFISAWSQYAPFPNSTTGIVSNNISKSKRSD
jgi:hypothetical protein